MRVNHQLINLAELAKAANINSDYLRNKIRNVLKKPIDRFTPEEQGNLREVYIELFEYIFEIQYTEVKEFVDKKGK